MTDTSKPAVAAVVERLGTRAGIGSAIDATHPRSHLVYALIDEAASLISALEAKLEKAAEALEPFAAIAEEGVQANDLDETVVSVSTENLLDMTTTMGDFRRAASTLSTLRETTNEPT